MILPELPWLDFKIANSVAFKYCGKNSSGSLRLLLRKRKIPHTEQMATAPAVDKPITVVWDANRPDPEPPLFSSSGLFGFVIVRIVKHSSRSPSASEAMTVKMYCDLTAISNDLVLTMDDPTNATTSASAPVTEKFNSSPSTSTMPLTLLLDMSAMKVPLG